MKGEESISLCLYQAAKIGKMNLFFVPLPPNGKNVGNIGLVT